MKNLREPFWTSEDAVEVLETVFLIHDNNFFLFKYKEVLCSILCILLEIKTYNIVRFVLQKYTQLLLFKNFFAFFSW